MAIRPFAPWAWETSPTDEQSRSRCRGAWTCLREFLLDLLKLIPYFVELGPGLSTE